MVCTICTLSEGAVCGVYSLHSFRGNCVWCAQFQIVKYFVLYDGPSGSSLKCPKGSILILSS